VKYKVWDELNGEESSAYIVRGSEPFIAAERYAEKDSDGHCEGLYFEEPQPISVRCVETGKLYRFTVRAEMSADFFAVEVPEYSNGV
jgi:hypothetical protein